MLWVSGPGMPTERETPLQTRAHPPQRPQTPNPAHVSFSFYLSPETVTMRGSTQRVVSAESSSNSSNSYPCHRRNKHKAAPPKLGSRAMAAAHHQQSPHRQRKAEPALGRQRFGSDSMVRTAPTLPSNPAPWSCPCPAVRRRPWRTVRPAPRSNTSSTRVDHPPFTSPTLSTVRKREETRATKLTPQERRRALLPPPPAQQQPLLSAWMVCQPQRRPLDPQVPSARDR